MLQPWLAAGALATKNIYIILKYTLLSSQTMLTKANFSFESYAKPPDSTDKKNSNFTLQNAGAAGLFLPRSGSSIRAFPICYGAKSRVHTGRVASPSQRRITAHSQDSLLLQRSI